MPAKCRLITFVVISRLYSGLTPHEMEGCIVTVCEHALTTTVNDIEHAESQSYEGISVSRVSFQPHVKLALALAETSSIVEEYGPWNQKRNLFNLQDWPMNSGKFEPE